MSQSAAAASDILDDLSFGNCSAAQQFPTAHCLPVLWFWWFTAFFFAAFGFALIGAMKIIRCYLMSKGRKDVYFNEFSFLTRHRGGRVEAGTSSIQSSEQWIDIEQRAALYSPDPLAAVSRAYSTRKSVLARRESAENRAARQAEAEEDTYVPAVPSDWFRERTSHQPDTSISSSEDPSAGFSEQDRPPSYSSTRTTHISPPKRHCDHTDIDLGRKRRMSLP